MAFVLVQSPNNKVQRLWNRISDFDLGLNVLPSSVFYQPRIILPKPKGWVAKVRACKHTCDLWSLVCMWKAFWNMHAMCMRAARFWACDVRLHFCTFLHTFWDKIARKCYVFEHPFLLWNILSCFGSSFSVLEHLILF